MEADVPRLAARVLSFVLFVRIVREVEKNSIEEFLFFGRGDGVASDDVSGDGVTRRRLLVIVGEGFLPYTATYCCISFSWWVGAACVSAPGLSGWHADDLLESLLANGVIVRGWASAKASARFGS